MKIAMAQVNPTVGALRENGEMIARRIAEARDAGADIVIFPEMAISGYPTYDLLYEEGFVQENISVLNEVIAPAADGITALVGYVDMSGGGVDEEGAPQRANCAAVMYGGRVQARVRKTLLPGYDVFDEKRYFQPAEPDEIGPVSVPLAGGGTLALGVEICEDLWSEQYGHNVTATLAQRGAQLIVNLSASPYYIGKDETRYDLARRAAAEHGLPLVYINMVGGQDELVFDGRSFATHPSGDFLAAAPAFEESLTVFDLDLTAAAPAAPSPPVSMPREEEIVLAQALNLRDYIRKQGCFKGIVVGTSGGVDSAYTLYIAVRAIGAENVLSVSMPSKFSSDHSKDDAAQLAANLGVRHMQIPIEQMFEAGLDTFERAFGETEFGVAEENEQARCRMQILMKISQKFGYLVCTTGNKSELSVGYWTLYGDGGGGKNVPGDLFKTELYKVCHHINREREIIPWNTINKPPSAELRPNQKDTDSLPDYEELDSILRLLVEERRSPDEIIRRGHDENTVRRVVRMYKIGEFKRGQMPQGIKLKRKSFGSGRRMPITNHWL